MKISNDQYRRLRLARELSNKLRDELNIDDSEFEDYFIDTIEQGQGTVDELVAHMES